MNNLFNDDITKSIADTVQNVLEGKPAVKKEEVKYPHMMYDPKTGKEVKAKTPADHAKYYKMGYTHDKPKMDEGTQYVIPEEIPANERTAFHGAAAAAARTLRGTPATPDRPPPASLPHGSRQPCTPSGGRASGWADGRTGERASGQADGHARGRAETTCSFLRD